MNQNMRITMNQTNSNVIQPNLLSDLVLNQLMDWIMDGKLHMGEKLNAEELASELGVSRMPIREALNNLEKMGLAESIPYVGTKLIKLKEEDVAEIYLLRQALEPIAALHATNNITAEKVKELEEIQENYRTVVSKENVNAKEIYQLNRAFHFTIYSASKMERLCFMIESLWDSLSFFKLIYGQQCIKQVPDREKMIFEHESYLAAVKKGDGELLRRLLSENLEKRAQNIPYETGAYFQVDEK